MKSFSEKIKVLWYDKRSWKARLQISLLCAFTFCFTFILFGPFELYLQNVDGLNFGFTDVIFSLLPVGLIVCIMFTLIFMLLHGKIFNYALSVLFVISLAGYIQGFININHGVLDGSSISWQDYKFAMLGNCLLWLFIILAVFFVLYFNKEIWQYFIKITCFIIIFAQTAALVTLIIDTDFNIDTNATESDMYISTSGIYDVAEQNNVIIFLIDRCDSSFVNNLIEQHPEWNSYLNGFVNYHNFTGSYMRTWPSVVYFLTGMEWDSDLAWWQYFKQAWGESTFCSDIKDAGYDVWVYTSITDVIYDINNVVDKFDNVAVGNVKVDKKALFEKMITLSIWRYSPEVFKPYFYIYSGELLEVLYTEMEDMYIVDDPSFWRKYNEQGLQLDTESNGSFKFYHLHGAHPPYNMNENAESIAGSWDDKDRDAQIIGNMNMIFRYIEELKEKGIYDNTTIIITTDHAVDYPNEKLSELDSSRVLTLLIKPAGADINIPVQVSNKQICQDNLRASIIGYFGLDTTPYGRTIESIGEDEQMIRYFWMHAYDETLSMMDKYLITYEIIGDANNFSNWRFVERKQIQ